MMLQQSIPVIVYAADAADDAGFAWAASLADRHDADLHVVHLRREGGAFPPASADRRRFARRDVQLPLDGRHPAEALDEYARRENASVIVMSAEYGTRGSWLGFAALARILAGRAACPVLAIPAHAGAPSALVGAGHDVLCAVDFSTASLDAVAVAATLTREPGSRLHLLHVIEGFPGWSVLSGAEAVRVQQAFGALVTRERRRLHLLAPAGTAVDTIVESGVAHRNITKYAADIRASLIVMGAGPRDRLDELVAGATIVPVLRHAKTPVLLVPAGIRGTAALTWIAGEQSCATVQPWHATTPAPQTHRIGKAPRAAALSHSPPEPPPRPDTRG